MDDQSLIEPFLKRVEYAKVSPKTGVWLQPYKANLTKADFPTMLKKLRDGRATLWEIQPPGAGVVVTERDPVRLFVYYLHGQGFLDRVTSEILLACSRLEGCSGILAEAQNRHMVRLLKRLGFQVSRKIDPTTWLLELTDGQA